MKIKCRPCCVDDIKDFMQRMRLQYPNQSHIYNEVEDVLINSYLEVTIHYDNGNKLYKTVKEFNYVNPNRVKSFFFCDDHFSCVYKVKDE